MNTSTMAAAPLASLTEAANGFRNVRAVASLLLSAVTALLLIALAAATGAPALIGFTTLLGLLIGLTGISAAGIHLMDQLQSRPNRSLADGFIAGLFATGKIIVMILLFLILALAFALPVALILLIVKIPFLGPMLYVVVVPVVTIAAALFYTGLFVSWQLLGPAIWEGNTMLGSLARLAAIARQRTVEVIINLIVLVLLLTIAAMVLMAALGAGYSVMMGMSTAILGQQLSGDVVSGAIGAMSGAQATGHDIALRVGTSIVAALGLAIITCPALMGLNIIYTRSSAGIDAADMEQRLASGLEQAKARATRAQESGARENRPGDST